MIDKRNLITETEASQELGLKVMTLRKRRWLGKPPAYFKIGSRIFYDSQVIREYINSCERKPTNETLVEASQ